MAIKRRDYQEYLDGSDKQGLMDDRDYIEVRDDELDIDEIVREQLILDMPQYPSSALQNVKTRLTWKNILEKETDSRWAGPMNHKNK